MTARAIKEGQGEPQRLRGIVRSVAAVIAGLLALMILSVATDSLLHATGIYPPWFEPMSGSLWLLAIAYRIVYGVFGGYVTARLAPKRPMMHALALGVVGLILSAIGALATWSGGPEYGPKWFSLSLIAIAVPCAWLGGRLYESR